MSATFTIYEKSGNTFARIRLSPEGASTFHSDHFTLDNWNGITCSPSLMCKPDWTDLQKKQNDNSRPEK